MNWHYAENGQQIGPVTDEQLAQLVQSGKITADTLVWHEGLADWIPYRQTAAKPPPGSSGQAPGGTSPLNENEVVCAECGRLFPAGETVRFGQTSVCAACKPVFLQKLSEGAHIKTGNLNYAGFWIRFAAKFVDGLILGVPFMIVFVAVLWPTITNTNGKPPEIGLLPSLVQFGFLFVQMGYQIFFVGKYGATPGKMVCKLQVVTGEGEKISYGRATGRFFAELLSGMICYIGYIMVGFDDEKRALHDHICGTRVIYREP